MAADTGDPNDPTEERIEWATPAGGVASVMYYRDAQGNPCPKSKAVASEAVEFDAAGNEIARTYFDRSIPS